MKDLMRQSAQLFQSLKGVEAEMDVSKGNANYNSRPTPFTKTPQLRFSRNNDDDE